MAEALAGMVDFDLVNVPSALQVELQEVGCSGASWNGARSSRSSR